MPRPAPIVLALAAIMACTDTAPLAPTDTDGTPVAARSGPPDASGIVTRGGVGFYQGAFPEENVSLTVALESEPAAFCAGEPFVTSPGVEQLVFTPQGRLQVLARSREAKIVLYGGAADFCEFGVTVPVIGEGVGSLQVTISNATFETSGALTYVQRVRGTVTLTDGSVLRVRVLDRGTITPDGTFRSGQSSLTLTPVVRP